ncbi:unnamed protein product [Nippostrongylus brasiliensis]|uniref:Recep_L_domain domain-containing protein n=1 Tax=Nippostrongylus brasiliensis TaxID=27835 RepID=A0A0N4Y8L3_NIPBR|nr:unnamed protein product [Nippostrongylus brasiliensis]
MARDGEQCSALVGEFKLNDSFELSSVWPNIRKVYGTITIVNTALTDLSAIRNVKFVDGWSYHKFDRLARLQLFKEMFTAMRPCPCEKIIKP